MKNIIISTQYFWPETFQINTVAENLSKKNIKVTVLTGLPNYPFGKIFKKYKNVKHLYKEKYKNITIYRCPVYPRKNGSTFNLIINYLSFVYYGIKFFRKIKFDNHIDCIISYSTSPITSNLTAIFLKKKIKTKLFIWLQDIWPESVSATNHIKNKFLLNIIELLVRFILNKADIIFVPFKSFIKNTQKKAGKKQIVYLPNTGFSFKKNNKKIPKKLNLILSNYKCFTYTGNIGKAQNIELIVNTASHLKNFQNIFFLIIGEGSEKKKIKEYIYKKNLKNILLFSQISSEVSQKVCRKSHGQIITLKNHKLFNMYIPNKFQNYLLTGKPIIASLNGELSKIIKSNKIGFASSANNLSGFKKNILKVSKMSKNEMKLIKIKSEQLYKSEYSHYAQIKKILNYI